MKADLKAGNPVYDAMTDLFKFHREYGMPEKEDRYWVKLIEAAGALNDKYKDTIVGDIVGRHLVSTMAMFDRMAKEGEKA